MIEESPKYTFNITCDNCEEEETTIDSEDWQYMIDELKDRGWRIRKDGDEWKHICEACQKELDNW